MAKLNAHGAELYRVEMANCRIAYMSDGHILRDDGGGWKLWRRCKDGVDPRELAEKKRQFYANVKPERTFRAEFRESMVREFPSLEHRLCCYTAISLMPDDVDGVWSTLDDYGHGVDLETVKHLCEMYQRAGDEGREEQARKAAALASASP